MLESMTVCIEADELHLAQLACVKLAGLVQGALSIGLAALVTGVPEPRSFLEDRFRVMDAFALVLHTVSGKPDGQEMIWRLRERSKEIMTVLDELNSQLFKYVDSSKDSARTLAGARNTASSLCDALGGFADLIDLERSRITKVKSVVSQVFDGVESWDSVSQPATT